MMTLMFHWKHNCDEIERSVQYRTQITRERRATRQRNRFPSRIHPHRRTRADPWLRVAWGSPKIAARKAIRCTAKEKDCRARRLFPRVGKSVFFMLSLSWEVTNAHLNWMHKFDMNTVPLVSRREERSFAATFNVIHELKTIAMKRAKGCREARECVSRGEDTKLCINSIFPFSTRSHSPSSLRYIF